MGVSFFSIGCSLGNDVAGGTTDSGNAIVAGTVVDGGAPVVGAKISLRPSGFKLGDSITSGVIDTVTDTSGLFSVSVPKTTNYTITVYSIDTMGAVLKNIDVDEISSQALSLALTPTGGVSGVIPGATKGVVSVLGTDLIDSLDALGGFFFPTLAQGTYDFSIVESNGASNQLEGIPIVSSEVQVVYTLSNTVLTWDSVPVGTYTADSLQVLHFLKASGLDETVSVDSVTQLSNGRVRTLDLKNLGLTQLHNSIEHLTFLEVLDMTSNQLTTLPKELSSLKRLSYLIADSNALHTLPDALAELKNLQYLKLSHNALRNLPNTYYTFPKLIKLGIAVNPLDSLPSAIGQLTTLELLDVFSCNLTSLPESIGSLTLLKELWASDNNLTTLPETMSNLTALKTLQLTFNDLTEIGFAIEALTELTHLDLYDNTLTHLPETITTLKPIEKLSIGKNFLCNVPAAQSEWLTTYAGGDWLSQQLNCQ